VDEDPFVEGQAVAEACVEGVLEVRVRVDEPREDGRVGEALALAELLGRADGDDASVPDRDCPIRDSAPARYVRPSPRKGSAR